MANDYEAYWWRGVAWLDWIDEIGVVERPTEDKAMRRLALQSVRALDHMKQVRAMLFLDVVREVIREEWGKRPSRTNWTLREVHAARGVELQWVEQVTKRGNSFTEVVEVKVEKAA